MAKKSRIERNNRVKRTIERYAEKRVKLIAIMRDRTVTMQERMKAQQQLAKLPRDSSPTRYRNRCVVTGNARGFYRFFGISRGVLRKDAREGLLPGIIKDSF